MKAKIIKFVTLFIIAFLLSLPLLFILPYLRQHIFYASNIEKIRSLLSFILSVTFFNSRRSSPKIGIVVVLLIGFLFVPDFFSISTFILFIAFTATRFYLLIALAWFKEVIQKYLKELSNKEKNDE